MSPILVDTHVLLWYHIGDVRLSATARSIIEDSRQPLSFSIVSFWEITIKSQLGRVGSVSGAVPPLDELSSAIQAETLPITIDHLKVLESLPMHHRDPFDRLLIAQAIAENMPVLTADAAFRPYPVPIRWAEATD
ncbi:MAG: type II toxin-antitoxin system VapC family toxin [Fimbriimonadaceae bacterium]|nr:type II toxin-antitoxin system VapC family toxin [Fimbriimonadaceae bacterium]